MNTIGTATWTREMFGRVPSVSVGSAEENLEVAAANCMGVPLVKVAESSLSGVVATLKVSVLNRYTASLLLNGDVGDCCDLCRSRGYRRRPVHFGKEKDLPGNIMYNPMRLLPRPNGFTIEPQIDTTRDSVQRGCLAGFSSSCHVFLIRTRLHKH
jgi:hypothetical protein